MANRKESAADIRVSVADEEVVVERLTLTKDIDVEEVYGSSRTMPDGYAINSVSYQGTIECVGNRTDLEDKFFDSNGIPEVLDAITVTHLDDSSTAFTEILITSEGYEMSAGESTTTSYDYIAMGKDGDNDPAN